MKKNIMILMISGTALFSISVNAQITNPYLDSTSTWYEINYENSSGIAHNSKYCNKYFIDGDTIIAGKSYHKLYRDQVDSSWDNVSGTGTTLAVNYSNHIYQGSLREDSTKRFYMYQNSSERLFYDFNLSIGDSLHNMLGSSSCSPLESITVSYIDTVYLGSRALKKFGLSSGKIMYEGIGAAYGLFNSYSLCSGAVIESGSCLNAYKKGLDSLYINCGSGTVWDNQFYTICTGQSLTVGNNTYSTAGTYVDTLTAFSGCDSLVTTHLTVSTTCTTGIAENSTTAVNVSPNPTTGLFTIKLGEFEHTQIKICDVLGKSVYQSKNSLSIVQIDLSDEPNGVYFVQIITDKSTISRKITISK